MEFKNGIPILQYPLVNENVALTATATSLNLTDDIDFMITILRRGTVKFIPPIGWDYQKTATGSGGAYSRPTIANVYTGVTNSSTCIAFYEVSAMKPFQVINRMDWSKRHIFLLSLMRNDSIASAVGRFQIKDANTLGAIGEKGIELSIANLTMVGAGYGSARGATGTIAAMAAYQWVDVLIDHQPAVPRIDFYTDVGLGWSIAASITSSANIPQVSGSTDAYYCLSIEKGAVADQPYLQHAGIWHLCFSR